MDQYTFSDRPDNQRLKASLSEYPDVTTPDIVQLFLQFQWAYRQMQQAYEDILAQDQLSESKFILLMFLKQAPDQALSPSDLAEKLGATRATTTKLLNKMTEAGWVEKIANPKDQRSVMIQLLPAGLAVLTSFLPKNFEAVSVLLENFSTEELTQFRHLLNKLNENTNQLKEMRLS